MIRVAINGYGRIGRIAHRIILQRFADEIDVVAINVGSSTDLTGWMYLLKLDSVYGPLPYDVSVKPNTDKNTPELLGLLIVDKKETAVCSQKDPSLLPWKDLQVDVVLECTGKFTKMEKVKAHLTAGAKKVVLSAPAKDPSTSFDKTQDKSSGQVIPTYILSVNSDQYKGEAVISNASCTTNCIAPVAKVMVDTFGVEKAMMTTVHGYTSDQRLHDGGHKDYRRARAAGLNIIPTSTGATSASAKTIPSLAGIFQGLALRVPVPVGSLSDFTFVLKRATTKEEVNDAMKKAAASDEYKDILAVTDEPLVSSDIIGDPHSSVVDLSLTQVVGGNMVKVIAWYDNEFGYANRLVEEVLMVGKESDK
ncbi:MAG: type I glyceraldehyde-3-phosphate dehydrogenase [Candidatus Levybacteria bacterium]|nr:type I glyceraldehyde-3-phosphate dehydrogenase [Candidatus Levybacteria bacterium]